MRFFALRMTTGLKIPSVVIPRRVFTQPESLPDSCTAKSGERESPSDISFHNRHRTLGLKSKAIFLTGSLTPAKERALAFLSSSRIPRAIWICCACGEPAPCKLSVKSPTALRPIVKFSISRSMRMRSTVSTPLLPCRNLRIRGPISLFCKSFADGMVTTNPPAMSCAVARSRTENASRCASRHWRASRR